MAAILCKGFGQNCGRTCHSISNLPGCCCDEDSCCYCGKACFGCGKYMSTLKHICTNPFGIFVTVTVVSNIPPMLIALTEVGNLQPLCHSSLWLLVNFLFCWVHIIASFYIAVSINHRTAAEKQKHRRGNPMEPKAIFRRAGNLFCYDPFMAVYIITVGFYVGFLFLPEVLILDSNNDGECSEFIHEKVIATVGFAWAFLGFGFGALALSFGFAYLDASRRIRHGRAPSTAAAAAEETDFVSDMETQATEYSNMEEGNADSRHHRDHHHGGSKGRGKRGGKDDSRRLPLDEYVPPMIVMDPTDDGVEMRSSATEGETDSRNKEDGNPKSQGLKDDGDTAEVNAADFVSDLETDNDDFGGNGTDNTQEQDTRQSQDVGSPVISPASSSKNTTAMRHHGAGGSEAQAATAIAYFADEEDARQRASSCDVPDAGSTTDGGGGHTDSDRCETTDNENYHAPPSFETFDIDQAIDLTDNDSAPMANLDIVLAVSQDPTVSISLTETDRSANPDSEDQFASFTGSASGSVGRASVSSQRASVSSQRVVDRPKSPISSQQVTADNSIQKIVDLVGPHTGTTSSAIADLDSNPTSPLQQHRLNQLLSGARTTSMEYDPASLTYSTSIGTLGTVIGQEPLSFMDGGGASNENPIPYASLREQSVLESSSDPTDTTLG